MNKKNWKMKDYLKISKTEFYRVESSVNKVSHFNEFSISMSFPFQWVFHFNEFAISMSLPFQWVFNFNEFLILMSFPFQRVFRWSISSLTCTSPVGLCSARVTLRDAGLSSSFPLFFSLSTRRSSNPSRYNCKITIQKKITFKIFIIDTYFFYAFESNK